MTSLLAPLADKVPDANDVTAGWAAFGIFIGLCLAVALLGRSLSKQLRRTRHNAAEGAFGPVEPTPQRNLIPQRNPAQAPDPEVDDVPGTHDGGMRER